MPKVRRTESYGKQILRQLRAKSLSSSTDCVPKMQLEDAWFYEVLWKLRLDSKEIGVCEK